MFKYLSIGLMALALFVAGCSGKQATTTPKASATSSATSATAAPVTPAATATDEQADFLIKTVVVTIDESKIDGERVASAGEYDLTGRLESGIRELLQGDSRFDSSRGDATLQVSVTNFRLRSGSSAFWLGAMAGADKIAVDVSVVQGDKVIRTFVTDVSTAMGGMVLPAPSQRINRMATELSRRIVDLLK